MLQELDVLIGFVVVMSVVCLLIMVITQAISSVLALRGNNLRDALVALFNKISPDLGNGAKELAEKVLHNPVFSDSALSMNRTRPWKWPSSWKLSSAIRAEECLEVIQKLADSISSDEINKLQEDAEALIRAYPALGTQAKPLIRAYPALGTLANALIKALSSSPAEKKAMQRAIDDVERTRSDAFTKIKEKLLIRDAKKLITTLSLSPDQQVAQKAIEKINQVADVNSIEQELRAIASAKQLELEKWKTDFEAAQERAEQWFTMNARWSTVLLAFPAAFLLQLDAFEVFNRISSDDALRNGLVNLSTAVEKRADEAMNQFSPGTVYFAVLDQMKNKDEDVKNFDTPQENDAQTYSDAAVWLHKQADHVQPPLDKKKQGSLIDRFRAAVQTKSRERLEFARQEFGQIAGLYGQSKLQLIPSPYPRGFFHFFGISHDAGFRHVGFSHLVGMLAAGMLLTLGAPFWFNLLKTLTNLRSSVSEKIDKENPQKTANKPK